MLSHEAVIEVPGRLTKLPMSRAQPSFSRTRICSRIKRQFVGDALFLEEGKLVLSWGREAAAPKSGPSNGFGKGCEAKDTRWTMPLEEVLITKL
jgi:hypothetical protein